MTSKLQKSLSLLAVLSLVLSQPYRTLALTIDEIERGINGKTAEIDKLQQEIRQIEASLNQTSAQKQSLSSAVKEIELTQKKLDTDISLTQAKLGRTQLQISELGDAIDSKEDEIDRAMRSMAELLRVVSERDSSDFVEQLLSHEKITSYLEEIGNVTAIQDKLREQIDRLEMNKSELEVSKSAAEDAKDELNGLQKELASRRTISSDNKKAMATLLSQTKNKEAEFKRALAEKEAMRQAFEAELQSYEDQLKIIIDPSLLARSGTKVLRSPVTDFYITQEFGHTAFSMSSLGRVYGGKGHSGIDLRASIGTPIMSAAPGKVIGTGNTDTACKGASYGKWVLVEHPGIGLSTLYAHLSQIVVTPGANVMTGTMLGYSGKTGYSTGPHLHFTVYATQGVSIKTIASKIKGCKPYTLPTASVDSYLNPLLYL